MESSILKDIVPLIFLLRSKVGLSNTQSADENDLEKLADSICCHLEQLDRLYAGSDELELVKHIKSLLREHIISQSNDTGSDVAVRDFLHSKGLEPVKRAVLNDTSQSILAMTENELLDHKFSRSKKVQKASGGGFAMSFNFDDLPIYEGLDTIVDGLKSKPCDTQPYLDKLLGMDVAELFEHPLWEDLLGLLTQHLEQATTDYRVAASGAVTDSVTNSERAIQAEPTAKFTASPSSAQGLQRVLTLMAVFHRLIDGFQGNYQGMGALVSALVYLCGEFLSTPSAGLPPSEIIGTARSAVHMASSMGILAQYQVAFFLSLVEMSQVYIAAATSSKDTDKLLLCSFFLLSRGKILPSGFSGSGGCCDGIPLLDTVLSVRRDTGTVLKATIRSAHPLAVTVHAIHSGLLWVLIRRVLDPGIDRLEFMLTVQVLLALLAPLQGPAALEVQTLIAQYCAPIMEVQLDRSISEMGGSASCIGCWTCDDCASVASFLSRGPDATSSLWEMMPGAGSAAKTRRWEFLVPIEGTNKRFLQLAGAPELPLLLRAMTEDQPGDVGEDPLAPLAPLASSLRVEKDSDSGKVMFALFFAKMMKTYAEAAANVCEHLRPAKQQQKDEQREEQKEEQQEEVMRELQSAVKGIREVLSAALRIIHHLICTFPVSSCIADMGYSASTASPVASVVSSCSAIVEQFLQLFEEYLLQLPLVYSSTVATSTTSTATSRSGNPHGTDLGDHRILLMSIMEKLVTDIASGLLHLIEFLAIPDLLTAAPTPAASPAAAVAPLPPSVAIASALARATSMLCSTVQQQQQQRAGGSSGFPEQGRVAVMRLLSAVLAHCCSISDTALPEASTAAMELKGLRNILVGYLVLEFRRVGTLDPCSDFIDTISWTVETISQPICIAALHAYRNISSRACASTSIPLTAAGAGAAGAAGSSGADMETTSGTSDKIQAARGERQECAEQEVDGTGRHCPPLCLRALGIFLVSLLALPLSIAVSCPGLQPSKIANSLLTLLASGAVTPEELFGDSGAAVPHRAAAASTTSTENAAGGVRSIHPAQLLAKILREHSDSAFAWNLDGASRGGCGSGSSGGVVAARQEQFTAVMTLSVGMLQIGGCAAVGSILLASCPILQKMVSSALIDGNRTSAAPSASYPCAEDVVLLLLEEVLRDGEQCAQIERESLFHVAVLPLLHAALDSLDICLKLRTRLARSRNSTADDDSGSSADDGDSSSGAAPMCISPARVPSNPTFTSSPNHHNSNQSSSNSRCSVDATRYQSLQGFIGFEGCGADDGVDELSLLRLRMLRTVLDPVVLREGPAAVAPYTHHINSETDLDYALRWVTTTVRSSNAPAMNTSLSSSLGGDSHVSSVRHPTAHRGDHDQVCIIALQLPATGMPPLLRGAPASEDASTPSACIPSTLLSIGSFPLQRLVKLHSATDNGNMNITGLSSEEEHCITWDSLLKAIAPARNHATERTDTIVTHNELHSCAVYSDVRGCGGSDKAVTGDLTHSEASQRKKQRSDDISSKGTVTQLSTTAPSDRAPFSVREFACVYASNAEQVGMVSSLMEQGLRSLQWSHRSESSSSTGNSGGSVEHGTAFWLIGGASLVTLRAARRKSVNDVSMPTPEKADAAEADIMKLQWSWRLTAAATEPHSCRALTLQLVQHYRSGYIPNTLAHCAVVGGIGGMGGVPCAVLVESVFRCWFFGYLPVHEVEVLTALTAALGGAVGGALGVVRGGAGGDGAWWPVLTAAALLHLYADCIVGTKGTKGVDVADGEESGDGRKGGGAQSVAWSDVSSLHEMVRRVRHCTRNSAICASAGGSTSSNAAPDAAARTEGGRGDRSGGCCCITFSELLPRMETIAQECRDWIDRYLAPH